MGLRLLDDQVKEDRAHPEIPATIVELRQSCAAAAVEILNGLLDYEKLESGLMVCEKSLVPDAETFLLSAIQPFQLSATAKGVDFLVESSFEGSARVFVDENKVSVLSQLPGNGSIQHRSAK